MTKLKVFPSERTKNNNKSNSLSPRQNHSEALTTLRIRWTPDSNRPRKVEICGQWSEWKQRHPMFWDPATHQYVSNLIVERGVWCYKIIRDGEWIVNDDGETTKDENGIYNSVIKC